ncbi:Hypothetical protein NTJ_01046 [Nesidiocoris tenuis]|uniref:UPAR/Ly6 domain-containing protein n=1 Tax=Nesidiocoris tenuis TaxID=355587 RepID=A0ABN7A7K4_9HEMI|nr:Hypothetical protein NTJ_01046 [Nesidiocoris tenuis]
MSRKKWITPLAVVVTFLAFVASNGKVPTEMPKTRGAKIPKNNLQCYVCDSTVDGERCSNLNIGNKSLLMKKCEQDERTCMVKRFSYTTSTENSTSILRMWSLQRSCTAKCEHGCIVIGERTKLYACTACCNKTGCNTGKGAASMTSSSNPLLTIGLLAVSVAFIGESTLTLTS